MQLQKPQSGVLLTEKERASLGAPVRSLIHVMGSAHVASDCRHPGAFYSRFLSSQLNAAMSASDRPQPSYGPPFADTLRHQVAMHGNAPQVEIAEQMEGALTQGDSLQDLWAIATVGSALEVGIAHEPTSQNTWEYVL